MASSRDSCRLRSPAALATHIIRRTESPRARGLRAVAAGDAADGAGRRRPVARLPVIRGARRVASAEQLLWTGAAAVDAEVALGDVLAEGFPDRMQATERTSIDVMYENERYGQKNNKGYYQYTLDRKGKPKKAADESVYELLKGVQKEGAA